MRLPATSRAALLACIVFTGCNTLRAQALPAATGPASLFSVGGEGSLYQLDYGQQRVGGVAAFADINPTWRLGGEAEVRFSRFGSLDNLAETTYLAGPRITLSRRPGRFRPYAKFLIGVGQINFPFHYATGSYLAYAPGGGLDYVLNSRWTVRAADFEYQDWPKFTYGPLHPYGVSAGIAFRFNPIVTLPKHANRW